MNKKIEQARKIFGRSHRGRPSIYDAIARLKDNHDLPDTDRALKAFSECLNGRTGHVLKSCPKNISDDGRMLYKMLQWHLNSNGWAGTLIALSWEKDYEIFFTLSEIICLCVAGESPSLNRWAAVHK